MTGTLVIPDATGDTKIMWDSERPEEVANARRTFDDLRKKGYAGYKVSGKEGTAGEVIREFDPNSERLIMRLPIIGG